MSSDETIVVSTADVEPKFPFRKHMLYTFIGEFIELDNVNNNATVLNGQNNNSSSNNNNMMMMPTTTTTTTAVKSAITSNKEEKYILKTRIVLESEGIDCNLYKTAIYARRTFLSNLYGDENQNDNSSSTGSSSNEKK